MTPMRFSLLPLAATALLYAGTAGAFCRTTTCDPYVSCSEDAEQCCMWNAARCDTNGIAVSWANSCVSYSIHDEPSVDRGISVATLSDSVDLAFEQWLATDCGGDNPSIDATNMGLSMCGEPTFNQGSGDPNANVWMFRDGTWPHADADSNGGAFDASTLALTTVTFNWRTGEILDADVELNTAQAKFTVGDGKVDIDLDSIVQHESGHFLGLDHSAEGGATMNSGYNPGTIGARSLNLDDQSGICAVYPKDREVAGDSCQAYGVYSEECSPSGCSLAAGGEAVGAKVPTRSWLFALAAGLFGLLILRRRTRPLPAPVLLASRPPAATPRR